MPYIDIEAELVSVSSFMVDTGRQTLVVDQPINTGVILAAFCNPHVNTSARFTAENYELVGGIDGLQTRANRYSVNDYVVIDGALYDVQDYPETFRVTTSVQGWNLVSTPRVTDPTGLKIDCTSRWIPKVGSRAMYDAGIWRPYSGSEPLEMYAVTPGDPQTPDTSSGLFPELLDNGAFTYVDRSTGQLVEVDAVQFTGSAKLSTNTSQWGSGHVAAMMVVVPSKSTNANLPTHLIGFAPNERQRSAGFTVSIDANSQIQLWSDRTEAMDVSDFGNQNLIATVDPRSSANDELRTAPIIIGLRYNTETQVATLLVCGPFTHQVEVSKEWVLWRGVPPQERLASCDLQLLYSPMENQVEVLDVAWWLGPLDETRWRTAMQEYTQCYGVL